jgi:cell division protein ZapB
LLDKILIKPYNLPHLLIMSNSTPNPTSEYNELEKRLDELLKRYQQLETENQSLKVKQESLVKEKANLLAKTTLAKTKVETMITRLKAMEEGL